MHTYGFEYLKEDILTIKTETDLAKIKYNLFQTTKNRELTWDEFHELYAYVKLTKIVKNPNEVGI